MKQKKSPEITREDLIYISRQFANMFDIPVRLYYKDRTIFSHLPFSAAVDPLVLCIDKVSEKTNEIDCCIYNNLLFYGIVNHQDYKFVAGPVSELKLPATEIKKLCRKLELSEEQSASFTAEMNALTGFQLDNLLQSMILYNFSVNKTMYNISDIRIKDQEQCNITADVKENEIDLNSNADTDYLKSYLLDKEIVKMISNGDVDGLIDAATKASNAGSVNFAPNLLRHHKDFFIKLEAVSARAAIEAGLNAADILLLEEMYIKKCETLDSIDRVKNLQYHMMIDYADRVKKLRNCNENNSKLVNEVAKYIRNHISEPIRTIEIAKSLGRSRGGLSMEFKKQTGMNLSEFVKIKKVQEAQELLYNTNKNIVEISTRLGFSSQSHFTHLFKQITGVTPKEYRHKNS